MIICPNCKEEIEDDSRYCDQCGHVLLFCNKCGRVGMGHRCTYCGGMMAKYDEIKKLTLRTAVATNISGAEYSTHTGTRGDHSEITTPPSPLGIPKLLLVNDTLNIRILAINGAIIGRKQGPYKDIFKNNMYVSGVHAQLMYGANRGWRIADKHSSNGTKLNDYKLKPDEQMLLKNGDIVTIANISLQVSIS